MQFFFQFYLFKTFHRFSKLIQLSTSLVAIEISKSSSLHHKKNFLSEILHISRRKDFFVHQKFPYKLNSSEDVRSKARKWNRKNPHYSRERISSFFLPSKIYCSEIILITSESHIHHLTFNSEEFVWR